MKLNLGCGDDVRINYLNIDIEPVNKDVIKADMKNLSALGGLCPDGSVDEILAINVLQYIRVNELENTLLQWHAKLSSGGKLFIESIDSAVLGNSMAYYQINIDQINQILYSTDKIAPVAIYNMIELENYLTHKFGLKTIQKSYRSPFFFFLEMEKP